jgi:hypothetical protein
MGTQPLQLFTKCNDNTVENSQGNRVFVMNNRGITIDQFCPIRTEAAMYRALKAPKKLWRSNIKA